MTERKYSIREIDEMRHLLETHYDFGWYVRPDTVTGTVVGRSYKETDKVKAVEERLRTLMIGGLTADDLRNSK